MPIQRDDIIAVVSAFYDAFFIVLIAVLAIQFMESPSGVVKPCLDFSAFFLAGRFALNGSPAEAYNVARMAEELSTFCGARMTMPWTYPPLFDLVVAPLALFPFGVAYGIFALCAYVFYCRILRRLSVSARDFFIVRLIAFPAIFLTLICGQGSLMVAGLIGWFCLALLGEAKGGGASLGLMIIKPHLAVSALVLSLLEKRLGLLVLAAAVTLLLIVATTLAFGAGVWPAFMSAAAEARSFLTEGAVYPLFRMVSVFAAGYTITGSLYVAFVIQGLFSLLCAWAIFTAVRLGNLRAAAGVSAIVAVGFSPYAYDYDLSTVAIGVALMLPIIGVAARPMEKLALLALYLSSLLYGLFVTAALGRAGSSGEPLKEIVRDISTQRLSLGGVAYACFVIYILYIVLRDAVVLKQVNPAAARV